MKPTFPLALKLSLWLLLNFVLLGALGLGLLVAQGGVSWGALVSGPAGESLQRMADAATREVAGAREHERDGILARYAATYGGEWHLFRNQGTQLAGPPVELPAAVQQRAAGPGLRGRGGPPLGREGGPPGPEGPPPGRKGGPPPKGREGGPPRNEPPEYARDRSRGRFVQAVADPATHWIGLRVPFERGAGGAPDAATLFIRVDRAWTMLRLLDLQPWVLAGTAVVAFSVLFWLPIVLGITRDLRRVTAATGAIAEGDFQTRVPTRRRDELGQLGESVNTMASRLDTLVNGQRRFLGDVAHELGSPLGRLQVATEILADRADPALRPHVADVREEVQQMSELVGDLLAFTKAGLAPRAAHLVPLPLADLVPRVLEREAAAGRVAVGDLAGLVVLADETLLARALGNLVRNALRYAGDAGPITLSAVRDGPRLVLAVEDHGPGVPPAALPRLGEAFFRPEAARTRETGGAGLGLAIVRSAALACGGEIHFSNRSPHGFRAELRLLAAA